MNDIDEKTKITTKFDRRMFEYRIECFFFVKFHTLLAKNFPKKIEIRRLIDI